MALYANLVPSGSAPPPQGTGLPDVGQLVQIRNTIWNKVLPDGRLKNALLSSDGSLLGTFKAIISLLGRRKYTSNQYILGERFVDQIVCNGNVGRNEIPDDVIPVARLVLSMLFGVRIWEGNDLDALDNGADAYLSRPNKSDIPRNAAERAAFLKKTYFPISTYNNTCWDIRIFDKYPLVAPVPQMNSDDNNELSCVGKLYNGTGLNGQQFVNGLLKYNSPSSGLTENIRENNPTSIAGIGGIFGPEIVKKYAPILAILIVLTFFISLKYKIIKP